MKFSAATIVLAALLAVASAQPRSKISSGPAITPSAGPGGSKIPTATNSNNAPATTTSVVNPPNTPSSGNILNGPSKVLVAIGGGAFVLAHFL
ncbi:MAG: hypothetical protein J3Q66DRAFT_323418 [Benniella sp.]|nr:MAG: hypothetical protein J3Q66DRAFT_323418 [Benniella sp.]